MSKVARGLGVVLVLLATIFLFQIVGVAAEVRGLPLPGMTPLPDGGISMDLRRFSVHHFYFTREAFILLHVWLIWAVVRLARAVRVTSTSDRVLAGASVLVLSAGHLVGVWLARQGTSVAIW